MATKGYLALDLGAESGRAILAQLDSGKVTLEEHHRFQHLPQRLPSGLHWNLTDLWANLITGVTKSAKAATASNIEIASIGCDTWGTDWSLVGKSGHLLHLPRTYRDEHHQTAYEEVIAKLGKKRIYNETGIQDMWINTLHQVYALHKDEPGIFENADRLLMIPDLLHFWFSGEMSNEATDISTTQMIDPRTGAWATGMLGELGLPTHYLKDTVQAGSVVGNLRQAIVDQTGAGNLAGVQIIAPGTHDTASAVAAVPADESDGRKWAYLSSGTWSLMGAEIDEPVINDKSCALSFTHERGVENKIRFLKNIAGLWLVQECRRDFLKHGNEYDYVQLTQMASDATPFRTLVDPDHAPFASPGDMPRKIAEFAASTGQPSPETPGQFVRCCLETLAMAYRRTLGMLEDLLDTQFDVLHIVGGGGRNHLLNQMTADAIGKPAIVGPYEATAIGNALTQAIGTGDLGSLSEMRQVIRQSFELETFEPKNAAAFDGEYDRYLKLVSN